MWSLLLGLLPGAFSTINGITNAISNERINAQNAKTAQEKIAAEERINALAARRDALIAVSGSPWTSFTQFMIALGPMIILLKFLAWDKVVGSIMGCAGPAGEESISCATFRTDPLDTNMWWVITSVVAFYFVADSIKTFRK